MMDYDFNEHRHNYAMWTAARAVQRGFANTELICDSIEHSGLKSFAESSERCSHYEFDELHKQWCDELISRFNQERTKRKIKSKAKEPIKMTYGRAAKIVAVYLKTSVIIYNQGSCDKCKVIHPPIDYILLSRIANTKSWERQKNSDLKTGVDITQIRKLSNKRWTSFSGKDYWEIVGLLREHFNRFDWTLERFWNPVREEKEVIDHN